MNSPTISTNTPATSLAQPDWIADIRERAEAALRDPFFVIDTASELSVWRASVLTRVTRNDQGEVTGWSTPPRNRAKANDLVLSAHLESWEAGENPEDDVLRADIAHLVAARDHDVPRLLAHVDELTRRLAAAEALLPGITQHPPGERPRLTVFEASHDGHRLGLYTHREAARHHGERLVHREGLAPSATTSITWIPGDGSRTAAEEASVFGPGPDDENITGYVVTPLALLTAPTSQGEEPTA